jgi:hypothetical protein
MKYFILIDGKLYGYNNLELLKIDIALNKPETYTVFEKTEAKLKDVYKEIKL